MLKAADLGKKKEKKVKILSMRCGRKNIKINVFMTP
jgi:hypothetical protein